MGRGFESRPDHLKSKDNLLNINKLSFFITTFSQIYPTSLHFQCSFICKSPPEQRRSENLTERMLGWKLWHFLSKKRHSCRQNLGKGAKINGTVSQKHENLSQLPRNINLVSDFSPPYAVWLSCSMWNQISNQFFLYFTSEQFKFTHQTNTYKGNIRICI